MTPLTFGGINSLDKAKKVDNKVDKIYLNSVLFENINLVANIYGSQSIMLGVNIMKKRELNIYNKPEKI